MTAEHYHALYRWFDAHPAARRFVIALDRWLPLVPFVCYRSEEHTSELQSPS